MQIHGEFCNDRELIYCYATTGLGKSLAAELSQRGELAVVGPPGCAAAYPARVALERRSMEMSAIILTQAISVVNNI